MGTKDLHDIRIGRYVSYDDLNILAINTINYNLSTLYNS